MTIEPHDPGLDDDDDDLFDAGDELDALNDEEMEHLPEAPEVGGHSGHESMFGETAAPVMGTSTSPRLFAQAAVFPSVTQLRVFKISNGVPEGLGHIDATATEEDFVRKFIHAMPSSGEGRGTFKLRPIDINMHEIGQQFTIHISEHHAALVRIRTHGHSAQMYGEMTPGMQALLGGGSGNSAAQGAMRLAERNLEMAERRAAAYERSLEEERLRVAEERERMAQERVDLAANSANALHTVMERHMSDAEMRAQKALEAEAQRNQMTIAAMQAMTAQQQKASETSFASMLQILQTNAQQQQAFLAAQMQAQNAAQAQQLAEERERRAQERAEAEDRRRRERQEAEERWKRESIEFERKRESERLEAERREREREADRARRHEMAMAEVKAQRERDREHQQALLALQMQKLNIQGGQKGDLDSLLEKGTELAAKFGLEPAEIIERLIGGGEAPDSGPSFVEVLPRLAGVVGEVVKAGMNRPRPSNPMLPPPQEFPQAFPNPTQPEPEKVPREAQVAPEAEEDSLAEPDIDLPLKTKKNARKAARKLIKDLRKAEPGEYVGLVLQAISMELALLTYLEATSIAFVSEEAGATPEEVEEIIQQVEASDMVPENIKRR